MSDDKKTISDDNPNHYKPSCIPKELLWNEVKDREIKDREIKVWNIIGCVMKIAFLFFDLFLFFTLLLVNVQDPSVLNITFCVIAIILFFIDLRD